MKNIRSYRVFIASPGRLDIYRHKFREILHHYSEMYGQRLGINYIPVGWDYNIPGGIGLAQDLINVELRTCDYFILLLKDRWGTPTGNRRRDGTPFESGVEEEFELAWELFAKHRSDMRNILVLFMRLPKQRILSPDPQLAKVLAFKDRLDASRGIYHKRFANMTSFMREVEGALDKWQLDGNAKIQYYEHDDGLFIERFQHPWLDGRLIRKMTQQAGTWAEIDRAWNSCDKHGWVRGISDLNAIHPSDTLAQLEKARMQCLHGEVIQGVETARQCLEDETRADATSTSSLVAMITYGDLLLAFKDGSAALEQYGAALAHPMLAQGASFPTLEIELHCRVGRSYRKMAEQEDYEQMDHRIDGQSVEPSPFWSHSLSEYQQAGSMMHGARLTDPALQAYIHYGMGQAYYGSRKYALAVADLRNAEAIVRKHKPSPNMTLRIMRGLIFSAIMDSFVDKDKRVKILEQIEEARNLAVKLGNGYEQVLLFEAEAVLTRIQDDGYSDYTQAKKLYRQALTKAESLGFEHRANYIRKCIMNLEKFSRSADE